MWPEVAAPAGFHKKAVEPFLVKYWLARDTVSEKEANAARKLEKVSIWVGNDTINLSVPILTNTKDVAKGDEVIWCSKPEAKPHAKRSAASDIEPVTKFQRVDEPKSKGKGKGKGKGCMGGNA